MADLTIIGTPVTSEGNPTAMVNLSLLRIGANTISDLSDGSPNAVKANAVWSFVRDEVLQAKDWRFAKIRYEMTVSETAPLYGYQYAYPLPSDFLRLVKLRGPQSSINPAGIPEGGYNIPTYVVSGSSRYNADPPVYPPGLPYIVEALPSGVLCLFIDYDNTAADLYINYIRRVTNINLYTPAFKNCLIFRLAQDLAVAITESIPKAREMERLYKESLIAAEAVNESYDSLVDETGSNSWEDAGR